MQQSILNFCVRWDFPTQTRFSQTHEEAEAEKRINIPTPAANPADLASVVAVELLAFRQQVDASSELQSPLHIPLEDTISPFLHSLGSFPVPLCTLKPFFLSVHFSLQQSLSSAAAQGLPVHFPSEASVVSLGQVLDSLVVAPFSFHPLEHFSWQQVPASEAAQEEPLQ
jgi:hypothetical protein